MALAAQIRSAVTGITTGLLLAHGAQAATTTVDLLVLYTPGLAAAYGGDATTRINHLVSVTNQIYADSGVDTEVRVVHAQQVAYPDGGPSDTALIAMTNGSGAFSEVSALRDEYGADMVTLYRPYVADHGSCGIAWVGGYETSGNFGGGWSDYMYSHTSATTCGDYVTAHELGHNMGLKHSRRQDVSGGTFHYALGHGVDSNFVTVMAYGSAFRAPKTYKFSSPALNCDGLPCGVDRTDTGNGADAVYALNHTTPQIANFKPTVVIEPGINDGGTDPVEQALNALESAVAEVNSAKNLIIATRNIYKDARIAARTAKTEWRAAAKTERVAVRAYNKAVNIESRLARRAALYASKAVATLANHDATPTDQTRRRANLYSRYQNLRAKENTTTSELATATDFTATLLAPVTEASAVVTATHASYQSAMSQTLADRDSLLSTITAYKAARTDLIAAREAYRNTLRNS